MATQRPGVADTERVASAIRAWRRQHGLSRREAAERLGLLRSGVRLLERWEQRAGLPSGSLMLRLMDAGVELSA